MSPHTPIYYKGVKVGVLLDPCYGFFDNCEKGSDKQHGNFAMDTEKIAERLVADTDPATETKAIVEKIAHLQGQRRDILNKAGDEVRGIDIDLAKADQSLKALVGWKSGAAGVALESLKKNRVDTEIMSSRTVDAIEHFTKSKLFPPPWVVEKSRWDIIEG